MDDIHFIKNYYYYLIAYILGVILISVLSYVRASLWRGMINFVTLLFSIFTVFYIGCRNSNIGVDTDRYENAFLLYKNSNEFFIRKDPFFDFLNFTFSNFFDFQSFLIFCAFIYVFGALYALKNIFKENYYLPFLVFLISPYFINAGINVMRSGIAASLFLVALSVYYNKEKNWKALLWFISSAMFHMSMFVPFLFFLINRLVKNTKIVFLAWLTSILFGILNINVLTNIFNVIGFLDDRASEYVKTTNENNAWINFAIFGFFPVIFAVYNVLVLKYKDRFYTLLLHAYMLTHIPYIILINSERASRLGYMAEFMMPVLLLFPLLIEPKFKLHFFRIKLSLVILIVFVLKAYKVLVV
jgi:hypothetical protein